MYAHPVPGDKPMLVCAVGPHYPQGNSVGAIKLIDLSKDNRTSAPLTNITPEVEVAPNQGGWIFAGSIRLITLPNIAGDVWTCVATFSASRTLSPVSR